MNTIKWELEDLAFAILYPKMYDEIVRLVAERAPKRDEYLAGVIDEVAGRPARRQDQGDRHRPPEALLLRLPEDDRARPRLRATSTTWSGIRVLVDTVRDCYAALGTVHARWNPVPGRFKDYIAMPKFNMYQSLHTTVIGPEGKPVELQIRTYDMHRRPSTASPRTGSTRRSAPALKAAPAARARRGRRRQRHGVAAPAARLAEGDRGPRRVPGVAALRPRHASEVFVFTPKGDVIALPAGSTPVDFAYAVHTEVGHRCIGARVNGRLVPLESTLDNGDVVEVLHLQGGRRRPVAATG